MKKIVFALATLAIVSCKKEEVKPVDYTLLTGKITNQNSNKLTIHKGRAIVKEISVAENGTFSDMYILIFPKKYGASVLSKF